MYMFAIAYAACASRLVFGLVFDICLHNDSGIAPHSVV